jgi:hypothetical protein
MTTSPLRLLALTLVAAARGRGASVCGDASPAEAVQCDGGDVDEAWIDELETKLRSHE